MNVQTFALLIGHKRDKSKHMVFNFSITLQSDQASLAINYQPV
jgi:hypothetical protein